MVGTGSGSCLVIDTGVVVIFRFCYHIVSLVLFSLYWTLLMKVVYEI